MVVLVNIRISRFAKRTYIKNKTLACGVYQLFSVFRCIYCFVMRFIEKVKELKTLSYYNSVIVNCQMKMCPFFRLNRIEIAFFRTTEIILYWGLSLRQKESVVVFVFL